MMDDTDESLPLTRRQFVVAAGAYVMAAGGIAGILSGCSIKSKKKAAFLHDVKGDPTQCIHTGGGGGHWVSATTCSQCVSPWCIGACPVHAINRDRVTGAVMVDKGTCIACGRCYDVCPSGMIKVLCNGIDSHG